MIEPNSKLSISRQCELLRISRSAYYHTPVRKGENDDIEDLKHILKVLKNIPFYGYRRTSKHLINDHPHLTWKRVRRIMKKAGLHAIFPKPFLSKPGKGHKIYPYLLKGKKICFPNQVWATDISYLHTPEGKMYICAIIDLYSRRVLTWRISNTMDVSFCIDVLQEAIDGYGIPAIFNSDQGSQFTSKAFTSVLKKYKIQISMDGKGRALDNVYIERLWRSLKYEDIYIKDYKSIDELREGVDRYFTFYNNERYHQSLDYSTPAEVYDEMFLLRTA